MFLKRILAIVLAGAMVVSILTSSLTVLAEDSKITGICGESAKRTIV